jgi:hypothetical protein
VWNSPRNHAHHPLGAVAEPVQTHTPEAEAALAREALPFVIVRRKAFPNAFSSGLSVLEQERKDTKAVDEILSVVDAHRRGSVDVRQTDGQRRPQGGEAVRRTDAAIGPRGSCPHPVADLSAHGARFLARHGQQRAQAAFDAAFSSSSPRVPTSSAITGNATPSGRYHSPTALPFPTVQAGRRVTAVAIGNRERTARLEEEE